MTAEQILPLVQSIVTWLSPFFPYLIKGVKLAGAEWFKSLGEKGGEEAVKKATSLWETIKKKSSNDKNIEGAALILSEQPESTDVQKVLVNALVEVAKKNPEFAKELEIFKENTPSVNINIGNIFTGETHVGGDVVGRDKTETSK
jgi:hypothetical protein